MAIAEACQLWIEQRIEEELQDKGETGKSLREIGRELAAEIEKVFEAKVDAGTLFQRARRQADTNVSPSENQAATPVQGGDTGDKLSPQEVVKQVDAHSPLAVLLGQKRRLSMPTAMSPGGWPAWMRSMPVLAGMPCASPPVASNSRGR